MHVAVKWWMLRDSSILNRLTASGKVLLWEVKGVIHNVGSHADAALVTHQPARLWPSYNSYQPRGSMLTRASSATWEANQPAHVVSQGSIRHSAERAICSLPHTWAHRCQRLARKYVIHPSPSKSMTNFALLATIHRLRLPLKIKHFCTFCGVLVLLPYCDHDLFLVSENLYRTPSLPPFPWNPKAPLCHMF